MAEALLAARTDSYFLKTKAIVEQFGDRRATYAVFMRRPVISTPRLAIDFLEDSSMFLADRPKLWVEDGFPYSSCKTWAIS